MSKQKVPTNEGWSAPHIAILRLPISHDEAANRTGKTYSQVTGMRRRLGVKYVKAANADKPPEEKLEAEFGEAKGVITTRSLNIKTLEDALRVSKVDLDVWKVDKHTINSWEVTMGTRATSTGKPETYTNYQVKVWLERKQPTILESSIEKLLANLPCLSAKAPKIKPIKSADRYLLEVSLFDAHFGMLAWNRESGADFDLKIAEMSYANAVEDLLAKTRGCLPEKIVFPVGNDFFHVNNPEGVTPHGHNQLDVDGRLCKVLETGERALIHAIKKCLEVAPVHIFWIPGNHDPETSYFVCRVLKWAFHNNPNVTVDVEPMPRKYINYGCNLIGYTHGNEERHADLPTIMATEQREHWAKCTHYEWHVGHFHKKKETRYLAGDTYGGVRVKTIPSIAGTDAWHFKKGYVQGNRMAEAFLYHYDQGLTATYSSFNLRYSQN